MKKRLIALCLLLALVLPTQALAAENSLENFTRSKTYSGQFSDLPQSSTHYANVAALYEYGLSLGRSDGSFGLSAPMRLSEVLIFASRIRSLYRSGDAEAGAAAFSGSAAYESHLAYLQAEGVVGQEFANSYFQNATRAQVAHVLANALPAGTLPAINEETVTLGFASGHFLSDVTEYTPYYQDILQLYRWGVAAGSDSVGSFYPDQPITRGAAAAMLTRLVDASLRLKLDWTPPPTYSAAGIGYGDLVTVGSSSAAPLTAAEMDDAVRSMLSREEYTLKLSYSSLTLTTVRQLMSLSLDTVKSYCEQGYNSVQANYRYTPGEISLTFSSSAADETQTQTYRSEALSAAIAVHDSLWQQGLLRADMTETEKAKVYYDWICQNVVYDNAAGDDSISHIPYAALVNGLAVCDGYTGAYNLFLKMEGISCTTQSNPDHIWTVATLDGTSYHIDTTWGDSSGRYTDYQYFAMTEAKSRAAHPW